MAATARAVRRLTHSRLSALRRLPAARPVLAQAERGCGYVRIRPRVAMPTHEIAMLDDAGNRRRFGVHEDGTFHVPIDAALLFLISTAGATVFELVRE